MEEIKSHIEVLKDKAHKIEQGKIKPFRSKVMEHYYDSMHEAVREMNQILKKIALDEDIDKQELISAYTELERFYKDRLDFQKRMLN